MPRFLLLLLCSLSSVVSADKATAFNINSVSCSTNTATIDYASCGMGGNDPCKLGDHITFSGTYAVSTIIPQKVEICGKVRVFGISVYDVGCWEDVDICEYLDCSNVSDDEYIGSGGSTTLSYSFDDVKIPGNSRWIGSGYGFGFVFKAYGYNGNELESCKVNVSTTTISTAGAVMAVASVCAAAAAVYYRRKRRTGTIDLEKEENLVQADFVEMSKSGVSV